MIQISQGGGGLLSSSSLHAFGFNVTTDILMPVQLLQDSFSVKVWFVIYDTVYGNRL